jgi:hypothetical protein
MLSMGLAAALPIRGDYRQAHREATEQCKALLVLLDRPGSAASRRLVTAILRDTDLSSRLEASAVFVLLRAEPGARYPIELYYTTRFPAFFLVDPRRELPIEEPCTGTGCLTALRRWLGLDGCQ